MSGAFYHITSRGDRQEAIAKDNVDRFLFVLTLARTIRQFDWLCHAYCLMDNHYHLVIETQKPNLAQGMRQLNGVYTQAMNRRHGHTGHLFQGRYKSILVDKNAYFAAVIRHAVLNLVRTGTVEDPADWLWSSHRATAGQTTVPDWLSTEAVLNIFERQGDAACRRYR
ncbi:MAG TPA: transposase, partial [Burkholderiaceae bacterium]|nr:transposase [Burkholderiaceae bacterium]